MPACPPPPPAPAEAPCCRCRRLAWGLLALCVLASVLFVFRAPVLTGAAKAWIVDEPLSKADAIVVLGGGVENRPFAAARFYHQGLAPKILFMDVRLNPTTRLGLIPPEADLTRQVLLKLEVPESDMVAIGDKVASTYDESRAVRAWVEKSGAKTLIIPDDLFHTRRVRWLFRKQLKGTGARALVSAVAPALDQYEATNWWQHEEGLIAFQNEVVKLMYYHLKY